MSKYELWLDNNTWSEWADEHKSDATPLRTFDSIESLVRYASSGTAPRRGRRHFAVAERTDANVTHIGQVGCGCSRCDNAPYRRDGIVKFRTEDNWSRYGTVAIWTQ